MYNKNAAYDLSLFEEKRKRGTVVKLNADKIRKSKQFKTKMILAVGSITVCMGMAAGIAVFISGQAQVSELTVQIDCVSKQIQEKEGAYTQLEMKRRSEILEDTLLQQGGKPEVQIPQSVEYIKVVDGDKAVCLAENNGIKSLENRFLKFWNNLFSI